MAETRKRHDSRTVAMAKSLDHDFSRFVTSCGTHPSGTIVEIGLTSACPK